MKKFLLFLPLLLLCACAPEAREQTTFAMDTVMQFTVYGGGVDGLIEIVNEYDMLFSPTREDSRLNAVNAGGTSNSETFDNLVASSLDFYERTDGAFDPYLGHLIDLWSVEKVPEEAEIRAALEASGATSNGAKLNLSAIAKGALSDAIVESLRRDGVKSAIISLGGNIIAHGEKPDGSPWVIGVRDPDGASNDYLATVAVRDKFVVSSGDYERFFIVDGVRYHHILDPKTGFPAQNDLRSVTIISENGALADAYSTALFVMGSEKALEFWRNSSDFEAVFVLNDNRIIVTEGVTSFNLTNEGYTYEMAMR